MGERKRERNKQRERQTERKRERNRGIEGTDREIESTLATEEMRRRDTVERKRLTEKEIQEERE